MFTSVFSCRDFILDPSPDRGASGIPRLLSAPSATVVVSRSGPGALVYPVRPVSITGVYGLPVEARAPQRDKKMYYQSSPESGRKTYLNSTQSVYENNDTTSRENDVNGKTETLRKKETSIFVRAQSLKVYYF